MLAGRALRLAGCFSGCFLGAVLDPLCLCFVLPCCSCPFAEDGEQVGSKRRATSPTEVEIDLGVEIDRGVVGWCREYLYDLLARPTGVTDAKCVSGLLSGLGAKPRCQVELVYACCMYQDASSQAVVRALARSWVDQARGFSGGRATAEFSSRFLDRLLFLIVALHAGMCPREASPGSGAARPRVPRALQDFEFLCTSVDALGRELDPDQPTGAEMLMPRFISVPMRPDRLAEALGSFPEAQMRIVAGALGEDRVPKIARQNAGVDVRAKRKCPDARRVESKTASKCADRRLRKLEVERLHADALFCECAGETDDEEIVVYYDYEGIDGNCRVATHGEPCGRPPLAELDLNVFDRILAVVEAEAERGLACPQETSGARLYVSGQQTSSLNAQLAAFLGGVLAQEVVKTAGKSSRGDVTLWECVYGMRLTGFLFERGYLNRTRPRLPWTRVHLTEVVHMR